MYRPIAGPFQGSVPALDLDETGLARLLDRIFATLALCCAGSVWMVAFVLSNRPDIGSILALSAVGLLIPSLLGLGLKRWMDASSRRAVARVYQAVFRRLDQPMPAVAPFDEDRSDYGGLAGLVADLAVQARKLHRGRSEMTASIARANDALQAGRSLAHDLGAEMDQDAARLAAALAEIDDAGLRLTAEAMSVGQSFEQTDDAIGRAAESVGRLASSVRTTTTSARGMANLAVQLAGSAHAAHRSVASLDDHTATLTLAVDQIGQVLRMAGQLGRNASEGSAPGADAQPDSARIATEVQALAAASQVALNGCHDVLQAMMAEVGTAKDRTLAFDEAIRSLHEVGQAVSHAVHQQGEDTNRILTDLYETRSGFVTLRAGVEAVTRAGVTRTEATGPLRYTVDRLPTHAESLAGILRGIPDFFPLRGLDGEFPG